MVEMRKIKCKFIVICVLFFASIIASCERRPLTYDHHIYHDVTIEPDWSKSLTGDEKPLGVSAWFFSQDGSEVLRFKSNNVDSFNVAIPEGKYDIVVFNQSEKEFSSIGFRGIDSFDTFEVYAVENNDVNWHSKTNDDLVVREPEKIAVTSYRDFVVTPEMVEASKEVKAQTTRNAKSTTIIPVTPELLNKSINVNITVFGIQNLRSTRASISGMAEGYNVKQAINNTIDATYILNRWLKTGDYGMGLIQFTYTSLGLISDTNGNNHNFDYWRGHLNLEVLLVDNKTILEFPIPLDGSMIRANSAGDIDLTITVNQTNTPVLPEVTPEGGTDSGFNADIEEWTEEVKIPIPIG